MSLSQSSRSEKKFQVSAMLVADIVGDFVLFELGALDIGSRRMSAVQCSVHGNGKAVGQHDGPVGELLPFHLQRCGKLPRSYSSRFRHAHKIARELLDLKTVLVQRNCQSGVYMRSLEKQPAGYRGHRRLKFRDVTQCFQTRRGFEHVNLDSRRECLQLSQMIFAPMIVELAALAPDCGNGERSGNGCQNAGKKRLPTVQDLRCNAKVGRGRPLISAQVRECQKTGNEQNNRRCEGKNRSSHRSNLAGLAGHRHSRSIARKKPAASLVCSFCGCATYPCVRPLCASSNALVLASCLHSASGEMQPS